MTTGGQPTVVVGADTAQAVRALQDVARAAALTSETTDTLNASLKLVAQTNKEVYDGQSRTLGLYKQLIGVTATLNGLLDKEAHEITTVSATTKVFAEAMGTLSLALKNVKKTSEDSYDGQRRTLDLYSRMLGITKQAADIKLTEAAATEKLSKAQATNIAATMKQEAADRKAAEAAQAKNTAASAAFPSLASPNVTAQWAAGATAATPVAGAAGMDAEAAAAQAKLGAAVASSQAALRQLEVSLGRTDALAERSAANRLTLAQAEVAKQEEVLALLLEQYEAERKIADTMNQRLTAPGAVIDVAGTNEAAAANARAAATAREAATAAGQLTAAKQAELRAEKELQALQAESNRRADNLIATQDKYTAAIGKSEAAYRSLNVSLARYESVAEKDAAERLSMATEERQKQEQILAVLLQQASVARYQADQARNKVSTSTVNNVDDISAATTAEARSAAAAREATVASRQLTAAQLEEERAAAAVAAAHEAESASTDKLTKANGSARYAYFQVAAAYGVVAAGGFLLAKSAISNAASYETAFAQVIRTTNQTAQALQPLYQGLEEMSTAIPVAFTDLAKISQLGAQMGIDPSALENFTSVVAKFSATTNVAIDQAATDFGKLSNLLGVPTQDFEKLASTVSYLGVTSVATETQILQVAQSIAATSHTANLSTQEVLGLSAAFASLAVSPEQARSAMTRLFVNVDQAISGGAKDLIPWTKFLGDSTQQFENLEKTNPDLFFNTIIEGFHKVIAAGGDITGTFDDLGIKSVRDIQVFERLAGSWNLVAMSIIHSNEAWQDGTYLESSFAAVNDTVAAKAKKVGDAYANMMANIGNSSVVHSVVGGVLDAVKGLLEWLDKLPSGISVGITAFTAFIGLFAVYKVALALGIAGMRAFQQTTTSGLTQSGVSMREFLAEARVTFGGAAAAATEMVTANEAVAVSSEATVGAIGAQTAALDANTVAAGANTAAKDASAAASAVGGLGSALSGFAGPLAIAGVAAFAIATVEHVIDASHAAEKAAQAYTEFKQSIIDAGGGMKGMADAIQADTNAFEKAGGKATAANGVYKTLQLTAIPTAQSIDAVTLAAQANQTAMGTSTNIIGSQTVALGKNTQEWINNALAQYLYSNKIISAKDITMYQALGVDIAGAIAAGLKGDSDKFDSIINPFITKWQQNINSINKQLGAAKEIVGFDTLNPSVDPIKDAGDRAALQSLQDQLAYYTHLRDTILQIRGAALTGNAAVQDAVTGGSLMKQVMDDLGIATDDTTDSLGAYGDQLLATGAPIQTVTDKLAAQAQQFQTLVGYMTDGTSLSTQFYDSLATLAKGISDGGIDFSQMTEAGRTNIANLLSTVTSYGAVISDNIKNGVESAQQGASDMAAYIVQIIQQLTAIGVPTDQLDFLTSYLQQITGVPWQVSVGADITGAVSGLNTLQSIIQGIEDDLHSVLTLGGLIGGLPRTIVPGGLPAPQYSGHTIFGGSGSPTVGGVFGDAKAQQDAINAANAAKSAAGATKDAATKATDAAKALKDAADAQTRYLQAAGAYFGSFAKNSLSMQDEIGSTVESLQKLGEAIAENGKNFNVVTANGRANWSALEQVFTNFGAVIQTEITNKTITAAQGADQLRQMYSGVYSELIAIGVPAADIDAYFKAMGIDTTGWAHASAAVKAYAGFITAAYDATGQFMAQTDKTADYVQRLTDALNTQATAYWGLQDAQDGVATQFNQMKKAQDDNAASVADLIEKNKELNATIGDQTIIANKAYANYLLAKKYGETGRAADYLQQYNDAKGTIATDKAQVIDNNKQITTLKTSKNLLTGNSQAAIDNRKSLQDLTNTYTTQIEAYAAAGHTQAQVAAYAKTLKEQFDAQAQSLGYTRDQLKPYDTELNDIVTAIGKVPTTITTTATANTSAASAALGAIPTGGTYTIKTIVDAATTKTTKQELKNIPNKADYKVTATANTTPATTALGKIPKTGGYTITPTVKPLSQTLEQIFAKSLPKTFNLNAVLAIRDKEMNTMWTNLQAEIARKQKEAPLYFQSTFQAGPGGSGSQYTGGLVAAVPMKNMGRHFAEGGLLPGTPPANPTVDNLMATGPQGIYHLRSREFIQSQPAVDYYGVGVMNALNRRMVPRSRFMASGGSVGGHDGGVGWGGPVELSMADRQLLRQIRDAQPNVYVGDSAVAHSSARGATTNTRRGGY